MNEVAMKKIHRNSRVFVEFLYLGSEILLHSLQDNLLTLHSGNYKMFQSWLHEPCHFFVKITFCNLKVHLPPCTFCQTDFATHCD